MMARDRNEATCDTIMRICRANGLQLTNESFAGDFVSVCALHEPFLQELLGQTTRPAVSVLSVAFHQACGLPQDASKEVALRVCRLVRILRRRACNVVTGSRTPPAVASLLPLFKKTTKATLGEALKKRARQLHREASRESEPCSKRATTDAAEVAALYGVSAVGLTSFRGEPDVESICSSPQTIPTSEHDGDTGSTSFVASASSAGGGSSSALTYWDSSRRAMVRAGADGSVLAAKMRAGPQGWQVAHWPDGSQTDTEVPNLVLPDTPVMMRKPAAAPEKPPAPPACPAAACAEPKPTTSRLDLEAGILRKVLGTKQAYITLQESGGDGKPHLLVSVQEKKAKAFGKDHRAVIEEVWSLLCEGGGSARLAQ